MIAQITLRPHDGRYYMHNEKIVLPAVPGMTRERLPGHGTFRL
jgi:hypothetical protein